MQIFMFLQFLSFDIILNRSPDLKKVKFELSQNRVTDVVGLLCFDRNPKMYLLSHHSVPANLTVNKNSKIAVLKTRTIVLNFGLVLNT